VVWVSTDEPQDERGNVPLTPIYAFNKPGEAIDLYSGPIGGLFDDALEGTIRLVPFPTPDLRWQIDVPNAEGYSTMDRLGKAFTLTASGMSGQAKVMSPSFGSVAGVCSNLELESGIRLDFAVFPVQRGRWPSTVRPHAHHGASSSRRHLVRRR
jgi:hypothetical protein